MLEEAGQMVLKQGECILCQTLDILFVSSCSLVSRVILSNEETETHQEHDSVYTIEHVNFV